MDIKLQVALLALVSALAGILITMWRVRKQLQTDAELQRKQLQTDAKLQRNQSKTEAELQRREKRIPVIQKLWGKLQPLSFFGESQDKRETSLGKITDDLTEWYYKTGGLYVSETSQNFYVQFQKSIDLLIEKYGKREIKISEITHAEFHLLQEESSALRSLTARDCGTRLETDSKYGLDAVEKIKSTLASCEVCNPKQ